MEVLYKTKNKANHMTLYSHSGAYIQRKHDPKRPRTPMFTAALFTIAEMWKQPECPSTEEWVKKLQHRCTMEYYSAIKNNEIMPFVATQMDLENVILREVSNTEKEKYSV